MALLPGLRHEHGDIRGAAIGHHGVQPSVAVEVSRRHPDRVVLRIAPHELPTDRLIAIATDDDSVFGVPHSRVHEVWSLSTVSWDGVGKDPTYNAGVVLLRRSRSSKPPEGDRHAIAALARELHAMRAHISSMAASTTISLTDTPGCPSQPQLTESAMPLLRTSGSYQTAPLPG
jgi:hypothetical protein